MTASLVHWPELGRSEIVGALSAAGFGDSAVRHARFERFGRRSLQNRPHPFRLSTIKERIYRATLADEVPENLRFGAISRPIFDAKPSEVVPTVQTESNVGHAGRSLIDGPF